MLLLSSLLALTACGAEPNEPEEVVEEVREEEIVEEPEVEEEEELPEEVEEPEEPIEEEPVPTQTASEHQWIFDELNGKLFNFSSGVGAWRTGFTFMEDGKFSGTYSDADGSEMVVSDFEGQFVILEKVDEVTYRL